MSLVPPGWGRFSDQDTTLFQDTVRLIAARDGVDLNHEFRASKNRDTAWTAASSELTAWVRNQREPANDLERLFAAMVANAKDLAAFRKEAAAGRAKSNPIPAPLSPTVPVRVLDSITGKTVELLLPRDMVRFA